MVIASGSSVRNARDRAAGGLYSPPGRPMSHGRLMWASCRSPGILHCTYRALQGHVVRLQAAQTSAASPSPAAAAACPFPAAFVLPGSHSITLGMASLAPSAAGVNCGGRVALRAPCARPRAGRSTRLQCRATAAPPEKVGLLPPGAAAASRRLPSQAGLPRCRLHMAAILTWLVTDVHGIVSASCGASCTFTSFGSAGSPSLRPPAARC